MAKSKGRRLAEWLRNLDSSGNVSNLTSTGIDDNATSTALTVTDSGIAATLTTAAQPNITSVGTLTGLSPPQAPPQASTITPQALRLRLIAQRMLVLVLRVLTHTQITQLSH
jgi:hypothetical protein